MHRPYRFHPGPLTILVAVVLCLLATFAFGQVRKISPGPAPAARAATTGLPAGAPSPSGLTSGSAPGLVNGTPAATGLASGSSPGLPPGSPVGIGPDQRHQRRQPRGGGSRHARRCDRDHQRRWHARCRRRAVRDRHHRGPGWQPVTTDGTGSAGATGTGGTATGAGGSRCRPGRRRRGAVGRGRRDHRRAVGLADRHADGRGRADGARRGDPVPARRRRLATACSPAPKRCGCRWSRCPSRTWTPTATASSRVPSTTTACADPAAGRADGAGVNCAAPGDNAMNAPTALSHLVPEIRRATVPQALLDALASALRRPVLHRAGGARAARPRRVLVRGAAAGRRGVRREHAGRGRCRRAWPRSTTCR